MSKTFQDYMREEMRRYEEQFMRNFGGNPFRTCRTNDPHSPQFVSEAKPEHGDVIEAEYFEVKPVAGLLPAGEKE